MSTEKRVRPLGMPLLATAFKKRSSLLQTPSFTNRHKRPLQLVIGLALVSALVVFATVMAAPLLTPFLPLLTVVINALASWASTAIGQAALAAGITALATSVCTALIIAIANALTADTQLTTKPEPGVIQKDRIPTTNPPDSIATIQKHLSADKAPSTPQQPIALTPSNPHPQPPATYAQPSKDPKKQTTVTQAHVIKHPQSPQTRVPLRTTGDHSAPGNTQPSTTRYRTQPLLSCSPIKEIRSPTTRERAMLAPLEESQDVLDRLLFRPPTS